MISKALFIIEAESMVIFAPILQLGCLRAWAAVAPAIRAALQLRKGPPLAVIIRRRTVSGDSPARHWAIAECSESTGYMCEGESVSSRRMRSPATTSVSLLAKAMSLPARMAATVGARPLYPTVAVTTVSMSSRDMASSMARLPAAVAMPSGASASCSSEYRDSSAMMARAGRTSRACSMSTSTRCPAANTLTVRSPSEARTTSNVCVPIDPVEPSTAMCLCI